MNIIRCKLRDLKKLQVTPNTFLEVKGKNTFLLLADDVEEKNPWSNFIKKNSDFIFLNFFDEEHLFLDGNNQLFYVLEQGGTVPDFITDVCVANQKYLKKIKLHDKVKSVHFSLCENLESLDLPNSVTDLSGETKYYFCGCKKLQSIRLPSTYKPQTLPFEFFSGCESLQSVDIPKSVKVIERSAFRDCFSLKEIVIPEGCVEIAWNAFVNCKSLEKVTLPESLEIIDWNAFENCVSLKEVRIPNSIKKIGKDAFKGCADIKIVAPDFVDVAAILRGEQWERE